MPLCAFCVLLLPTHYQVSDIKRANGILSDNAMFAREHVKIPTGTMPLRYVVCCSALTSDEVLL